MTERTVDQLKALNTAYDLVLTALSTWLADAAPETAIQFYRRLPTVTKNAAPKDPETAKVWDDAAPQFMPLVEALSRRLIADAQRAIAERR